MTRRLDGQDPVALLRDAEPDDGLPGGDRPCCWMGRTSKAQGAIWSGTAWSDAVQEEEGSIPGHSDAFFVKVRLLPATSLSPAHQQVCLPSRISVTIIVRYWRPRRSLIRSLLLQPSPSTSASKDFRPLLASVTILFLYFEMSILFTFIIYVQYCKMSFIYIYFA